MKRKWIAALLSLVMAAALIPAAAFAVEPGVSNDTQKKTYATIQAALDDAAEGDVITLSAGVYKENLTVSTAVTIQGPANGEAVIQFDAATKQAQEYFGGRTAHPTIYATADLTLKNLTVAGPTNIHHGIDGILAKADLTMEGVTVKDIRCTADGGFVCGVQYGLGVMVDGEGDVTIRDCQIVDFQKQAIDLNTTGNIIIESNIITGVGEQAIIAQNGLVTAKAVGTAVITVKNAKGDAKTCTITVQAAAVDGGEEAPATGDSSSLVLWVGMLTVSALAGTALLVKKHLGSIR